MATSASGVGAVEMAKAWYEYSTTTVTVDSVNDDLLFRDVSDTADNATYGTVRRAPLNYLLGLSGITPGGRLTLESGVPVSTSNQTAKSTLYYTPFVHDFIRLYDGTRPKLYQFSELSLALSVTSGSNYDVFVYDNSGSLALELSSAWTNDTTRANALAWQAGVGWVKSGSPTRLWVGTKRASGTNTCEFSTSQTDAACKLFLWNAYNRVRVPVFCHDSTDNWTYTTAAWRQKRGSANNQIEFLCGLAGASDIDIRNAMSSYNSSAAVSMRCGVGLDSTSTLATGSIPATNYFGTTTTVAAVIAMLCARPSLGYHYCAALEYSDASGTTTWLGDNGVPSLFKSGLTGFVEC